MDVLYRPGNSAENNILRSALWDAWSWRCYWCGDPRDLRQVEIDHMVPQAMVGPELEGFLATVLSPKVRPDPFEIHAPYNLAPICRRCNGEKSARNFIEAPRFMSLLRKAIDLEPKVVEAVRKFHKRNAFTQAMMTVAGMGQDDPDAMEAVAELGPLFINRLRYLALGILEGLSPYEFSDPMAHEMRRVSVTLDEAGRRARVVLEDAYGCDFDEVLIGVSRAVTGAVEGRLSEVIAGELAGRGYDPDVGPAEGWVDIAIDRVVQEVGDQIFECGGTYEADGSAFAAIQDPRSDSGTAWVQREVDITGRFTVSFWLAEGPPEVDVGDVELVEFRSRPTPGG